MLSGVRGGGLPRYRFRVGGCRHPSLERAGAVVRGQGRVRAAAGGEGAGGCVSSRRRVGGPGVSGRREVGRACGRNNISDYVR